MASDTFIIVGIGMGLAVLVALPFVLRLRRRERRSEEARLQALRYGLHEPVSLHPVVDPERCIGTGSCIDVCPEGDVLGLRHGQALAIGPARCIGHGLCERACPMAAIQLVFGTEKRGVQLPRVREDFQTNVPGLYIVGELGGMGLIRNAFEQGRQCVEGIVAAGDDGNGVQDLAIVGCGPAGLSASLTALHHGLSFVTVEREDIGGTVRHYPRKKLVMTSPLRIPGYGRLEYREIQKEALIEVWEEVVERSGLQVRTRETVANVRREDGVFRVVTDHGEHAARRVVLAIGRRGTPRKLGVPGEELPKVAYALREPESYTGDRVLVVGGGDSAVEAAMALADQPGNEVTLSYRKSAFSRIKPGNLERIEAAVAAGAVRVVWNSEVSAIAPDAVELATPEGTEQLPNDQVFVFIGGELPIPFLEACGVAIDVKFGEP